MIYLNDEVPPEQLKLPTESNFLLIVYYVVAFLCTLSCLLLISFSCCYVCCLIVWFTEFKRSRQSSRVNDFPEERIGSDIDPADRAAIELAMRDFDRVDQANALAINQRVVEEREQRRHNFLD